MKKSKKQREAFAKNRNTDTTAATRARTENADAYALRTQELIKELEIQEGFTLQGLAEIFTAEEIPKPRGKCNWSATDVRRLRDRIAKQTDQP